MFEIFATKSVILAGVIGGISFVLTCSGFITYSSPIVTIEDGQVQGRIGYSRVGNEYFEYLGIPFAEAPVGDLRFEAPVPVKPWMGLKQVVKFPPFCLQLDAMVRGRIYGVEDCLFLNVFTHSVKPKKPKAVMVFIHGGGFMTGSSSMYGPKYFMDEDVVLVTMNYRLGPLGFLNSGDHLIRGNMGLKDQNLALRWVQKNIDKFGGDPNRVTIFGESAGAASVQYHIVSKASEGLFQRAIAQSGAVTCPWSFTNNAKEATFSYGEKVGCNTENSEKLVECLKKMDAIELIKPQILYMNPISGFDFISPSAEAVVTEDTFLSENPRDILKSGKFAKVPLMMGVLSSEGGLKTARLDAMPETIPEIDKRWTELAPSLLWFDKLNTEVSKKIRDYYFGGSDTRFTDNLHEFRRNYSLMGSDGAWFEPVHRAATLHAKQGAPTYLYYYTYDSVVLPNAYTIFRAVRPDDWIFAEAKLLYAVVVDWFKENVFGSEGIHEFGATHADDIFQLFNMEWIIEFFSTRDFEFSKKFVKVFVDFAKNEEPLKYDGVIWPPIKSGTTSDEPLQCMRIDKEGQVIPEPYFERVRFWESLKIRDSK